MAITSLALLLAFSQRAKDQYTLGYAAEQFVARKGTAKEVIPAEVPPAETNDESSKASYRRDKRWVVWDERGLTTRDGSWTYNDQLEAIPVSPRIQKKAQILDTQAKIKAGKRTRKADALSGSKIISGVVYLLPRWEESDGTPWLEALIAVDLTQPHPKPKLLGTFGGLSLGNLTPDETTGPKKNSEGRLRIENGLLTVPVNTPNAWGMATFDPRAAQFSLKTVGTKLYAFEADGRLIEGTSYGTTLAGHWADGRTIPWLEIHGTAEFVPGAGPILVKTNDRLRNAVTGSELKLAPDAAIRRSKYGIVVFWPENSPRSARLVEPSRFEELARWESGTK